ncbi:uncharacterized protein rab44 [Dunckerocampus dactyliophorus]|uniref:uncharacterized protein rab44 n=1 Tax=Dunckerocampus dactyliophorus TaxID=161453 RepID=UPI002405F891|nr:uncharacterized protein rab44 [Dunckerocampus dactyliophorus]
MPGPSGKKRLSSRRRVIKHDETPVDLTVSDQSNVAQPEESNPTPLETHHLLSSEQKDRRRKLSSNQQSQRKYQVEQSSAATYHKPTEEVEQNVSREQYHTTQMIETQQALQKGFNKTDEYGAHLDGASTSDHALDALDTDVKSPQPVSETLHLDDQAEESGSRLNAEPCKPVEKTVTTAEVVGCSTHSTVEQQLSHHAKVTAMPVYIKPVPDSEKEDINEETDLLPLIEHSTEGITFSTGPEMAPDKRDHSENDEIRNRHEQADYSLAVEELPVNEEQHEHFDISQVRGVQHPHIVIEYVKSSQTYHAGYSEILTRDHKEDIDQTSKHQIMEMEMHQSQLIEQIPNNSGLNPHEIQEEENMDVLDQGDENDPISTTNMEVLLNLDNTKYIPSQEHDDETPMVCNEDESAERVFSVSEESELSSQSVEPQKCFVVDSQSVDNNVSADEQGVSFSPAGSRRKLGSSRRNKGSRVKVFDTFSELKDAVAAEETTDDKNLPELAKKTAELVSEETLLIEIDHLGAVQCEDMSDRVWKTHTHSNSAQLLSYQPSSRDAPVELSKVELQTKAGEENATLLMQNRNVEDSYLMNQPLVNALASSATPEVSSLHDDAEIEDRGTQATISSPKAETSTAEAQHEQFNKVDKVVIKALRSSEIDHKEDSEMLMHDRKEDVDKNIENLVEEIREIEMHQSHDSSLNQHDKQEEDTRNKDNMEDLDQRDEHDPICSTMDALINLESTEHTPPQEHNVVAQMVSDVEQSAERVVESELSSPDQSFVVCSQSEDNKASADDQRESFSPARSRRKLGSSRRNKGSCVKVFDTFNELQDAAAGKTRDENNLPELAREMAEMESKETVLIETDDLGTTEGEHRSDLVWKSAHVVLSESSASNTSSNSAQLLSEQSNSREMLGELSKVEPETKPEEETLLTQNRNVEDGCLVSQPLLDAQVSSATPEISSLHDDADIDATISSPKAETATAEVQHEQSNECFFHDRSSGTGRKEDFARLLHQHKEDVDKNIENLVEEIKEIEMHQSHESSLNQHDKQEEDAMKEDNMEDLDQRDENDSICSTMDALINLESTEHTPPQEHNVVAQMVSDVEQSTKRANTSCIADAHTGGSVAKATTASAKQETSSKVEHWLGSSEGYSAQKLEDAHKIHMVYPVEVNEVDQTDYSTVKACSSVGTMQSDASLQCVEVEAEGTLCTREETVPTEQTGQQASQEQSAPHFKPTEQMEVKVAVQEDEDISPKSDKDDLPDSEGEDMDTSMHRRTSSTLNVQEAEETFLDQNLEAVSLKKESLTNKEKGELHVLIADGEEVEQQQGGSEEKPNATLAPEAFGLEENYTLEPAVGVCDTGIADAAAECQSQQEIHEESLNLLVKTNTKKRKMGSTRMRQINRKQETQVDNLQAELDMGGLENVGVLEDVPHKEALENQRAASLCKEGQEMNKAEADEYQELHSSTEESHVISATDVTPVLPEQSSSCHAEGTNPLTSQVDDLSGNENAMAKFEPDHEVHIITSVDTELHPSTRTIQSVTLGKDSTDSPAEEHRETQTNTEELRSGSGDASARSPNLSLTHRKRKMGSTRRNLGTMSKGDLEQKLDVNNESPVTAHVQDIVPDIASRGEGKELKPRVGYKDSEATKDNVVLSHTGDLQNKTQTHRTPKAHQTSAHHMSPRDDLEETSPKLDVLSELTPRGRRRKLGSHRKSRGGHRSQGEDLMMKNQPEATTTTTTDKCADDTIQGRKESENHETDTKASSNITIPKAVRRVTSQEMTPSNDHHDRGLLGHDTHKNISSGNSDLRAKTYNVVLVGDSCVGKTSFMRRAQNGKFYPDMPASVGLDTCLWTVVVEGKPVVLQLWDTAGQERFHSVTKQIFHRAHAFLLMYDVTSLQSFTAVYYWASCIQEGAVENIPILLLGNKSDHAGRHVKTEEGQNIAKEFNVEFMECSAVTGDNVIQSLEAVARLLSQEDGGREETLVLHKEPAKKTSGCC